MPEMGISFSTPSALPASFWGFSPAQELRGAPPPSEHADSQPRLLWVGSGERQTRLPQVSAAAATTQSPFKAHHELVWWIWTQAEPVQARTPEHVNSRKNSSRTKPHTETSGLGEGDSRRSWHRGERKEIRGTARLQPSAIKETLHRLLTWQKALVVCSGCDLQLPSSTAWLRRQRRWNSSMTTAAPHRPL